MTNTCVRCGRTTNIHACDPCRELSARKHMFRAIGTLMFEEALQRHSRAVAECCVAGNER